MEEIIEKDTYIKNIDNNETKIAITELVKRFNQLTIKVLQQNITLQKQERLITQLKSPLNTLDVINQHVHLLTPYFKGKLFVQKELLYHVVGLTCEDKKIYIKKSQISSLVVCQEENQTEE